MASDENERLLMGEGGPYRTTFISHRCNVYHNSITRQVIEKILPTYRLGCMYGCRLDPQNVIGNFTQNVTNTAKISTGYIPIIESSWSGSPLLRNVTSKWPPLEYKLWRDLHPESKYSFGLIVNGAIRPKFLDDIPCYYVYTKKTNDSMVPILDNFNKPTMPTLWARPDEASTIRQAFNLLSFRKSQ